MITVKPYGGLGNRIRVLYSVLGTSQKWDHQIKIIWDCHQELNCPFEELFLIPENCRVRNIKQGLIRKLYRYTFDKLHLSKLRSYRYDLVLSDKEISNIRKKAVDPGPLFEHSNIYIESCLDFYRGPEITDFLTINPAIKREAQKTYDTFGTKVYGIHVRQTDNIMSKKYSSPSAFQRLIRKRLREESDAQFFLATDSMEVEERFMSEFGKSMIVRQNKELDRNSEQGVKDALIEMICLSKTKKIYGSYYSSFTSVSAMLSGVGYENVIAQNAEITFGKN